MASQPRLIGQYRQEVAPALMKEFVFLCPDADGGPRPHHGEVARPGVDTADLPMLFTGILYIILGMLVDISVIILLTGPIIAPLIAKVGLDPLHTAMIYMVILAIGLITPPVGKDLFVASGISGIPVDQIAREAVIFVLGMLFVVILMWIFPWTATWIPSLVSI